MHKQVVYRRIHSLKPLLVETIILCLWHRFAGVQKNGLSYPSRYRLSQHPHGHPLEWVTEVAKGANIAKMAEKCINCTSARPTLPHTNPMESGPRNTSSRLKPKKTKRFMFFNPQKGGDFFSKFLNPPPPACLKSSKK